MSERRDGRAVVITGASAGIGRAFAFRCAAAGLSVVLMARREERLQAAADEIRRRGGRAAAAPGDVTDPRDVEAAVRCSLSEFGRLDVMVCNAGIGYIGLAEDTPPAVMRRLLDVNFMGTFHGVRAAVPVFRQQGSGHVMIVSSIVGKRGMQYLAGYCATKAAQIGFAEALRAELRGAGVRVTVVCPVSTRTEFLEVIAREQGRAAKGRGPQQSAQRVADAMFRALKRPVREVYPYAASRALPVLDTIAPRATDWIIRRLGRRSP